MYAGEEMCIQCFRGENLRERDPLEAEADDQIILKYLFKKSVGEIGMYSY